MKLILLAICWSVLVAPQRHVAVAVTGPVELSQTIETGSAEREENMWVFADAALKLLERAVRDAA